MRDQDSQRWDWLWHVIVGPVAAWFAWHGGWVGAVVVLLFVVEAIVSDRLIYWQRRYIEALEAPTPVPPYGMIVVTLPGQPSVALPINADEAAALAQIVSAARGDE